MNEINLLDLKSSMTHCPACNNLLNIPTNPSNALVIKKCSKDILHFKILRTPKGLIYRATIQYSNEEPCTLFFNLMEHRLSINNFDNTNRILSIEMNEDKFLSLFKNRNKFKLLLTFS